MTNAPSMTKNRRLHKTTVKKVFNQIPKRTEQLKVRLSLHITTGYKYIPIPPPNRSHRFNRHNEVNTLIASNSAFFPFLTRSNNAYKIDSSFSSHP
ncbi:hypothetical protein AVEN_98776-1 [Araneus ventricosus]|uniref:Uncharacterized protein n=1 Tax=Araneus ventricosus TaxID=182803 RepID=A0A4Y2LAM2_ARAVE|nr:hypothetical protein AVEN_98776-1 [Araneus ventricosus]